MAHCWILWLCDEQRIHGRHLSEASADAMAAKLGFDDFNVFPCEDLPLHEPKGIKEPCDSRVSHNARVAESGQCDRNHKGLPSARWGEGKACAGCGHAAHKTMCHDCQFERRNCTTYAEGIEDGSKGGA